MSLCCLRRLNDKNKIADFKDNALLKQQSHWSKISFVINCSYVKQQTIFTWLIKSVCLLVKAPFRLTINNK